MPYDIVVILYCGYGFTHSVNDEGEALHIYDWVTPGHQIREVMLCQGDRIIQTKREPLPD